MADFHQNGNIATIHNLRTRTTEDLTHELVRLRVLATVFRRGLIGFIHHLMMIHGKYQTLRANQTLIE